MPSETESLAMQLVRALSDAPDGRPMHWRTVETIGRAVGLDDASEAIAYAVEREWLLTEGEPPHSICLTDAGGRLVEAS